MITQLDIFTAPPPAQRHSQTSVAAAKAIEPNAGTQRAMVLAWLKEHGPSTDEEIQEGTGMNPSSERPRRIELVKSGQVVNDGVGMTKAGRAAQFWRAV